MKLLISSLIFFVGNMSAYACTDFNGSWQPVSCNDGRTQEIFEMKQVGCESVEVVNMFGNKEKLFITIGTKTQFDFKIEESVAAVSILMQWDAEKKSLLSKEEILINHSTLKAEGSFQMVDGKLLLQTLIPDANYASICSFEKRN